MDGKLFLASATINDQNNLHERRTWLHSSLLKFSCSVCRSPNSLWIRSGSKIWKISANQTERGLWGNCSRWLPLTNHMRGPSQRYIVAYKFINVLCTSYTVYAYLTQWEKKTNILKQHFCSTKLCDSSTSRHYRATRICRNSDIYWRLGGFHFTLPSLGRNSRLILVF